MQRLLGAVLLSIVASMAGMARADDQATAQQVAQRLKAGGHLQGYSIGIKAKGGVVWLRGEVATAQQAALALRTAKATPSVRQVVNNLTVAAPAPASAVRRAGHQMPTPAGRRPQLVAMRQGGMVEGEMPITEAVEGEYEEGSMGGGPLPMSAPGMGGTTAPAYYDQAHMPGYAWPSYAAYPNYAGVTYPKQYSPTAWPFIGPFYPYPQVPLGWRKVTLEWDDGWWMLDFQD